MFEIKDIPNGAHIFTRDANPLSALIRNTQEDFDRSHVASLFWINGRPVIYTTGARWDMRRLAFVYGTVPAEQWLASHDWIAGIRSDLTQPQQELRRKALQVLVDAQTPYAVAKVARLALAGRVSLGYVKSINRPPEWGPQPKMFCSEAEAYSILMAKTASGMSQGEALRSINSKYPYKLEACVHSPETLCNAPETNIIWESDTKRVIKPTKPQ